MIVDFIHRKSLPNKPKAGSFYWIDTTGEIWFAPDSDKNHMKLISNDSNDLTDSDIDEITERIESKIVNTLSWKEFS